MDKIRTVIVASTLAMRAGLRALLESDPFVEVSAEAAGFAELEAPPADTDVLVSVGGATTRAELEAVLASFDSSLGFVLMTDEPGSFRYLPRLPLRAWGLLPLDSSAEELTTAVRSVHRGLITSAPTLLDGLLSDRDPDSGKSESGYEELSEREMEVLLLLAEGLANKQIAGQLGISEHTVKFHVSSIYGKLGATNRAEAVRLGARQGLIPL